jgi:hypothetical protein
MEFSVDVKPIGPIPRLKHQWVFGFRAMASGKDLPNLICDLLGNLTRKALADRMRAMPTPSEQQHEILLLFHPNQTVELEYDTTNGKTASVCYGLTRDRFNAAKLAWRQM